MEERRRARGDEGREGKEKRREEERERVETLAKHWRSEWILYPKMVEVASQAFSGSLEWLMEDLDIWLSLKLMGVVKVKNMRASMTMLVNQYMYVVGCFFSRP